MYLDPPYEGTTTGDNKHYHQGLERERLIGVLESLNRRGVPFLLSYDGQCGEKVYGSELPASLHLTRLELNAGRSSQATLNGREEVTIESLYVSSNLVNSCTRTDPTPPKKCCLLKAQCAVPRPRRRSGL